jgi:hypothetical protein
VPLDLAWLDRQVMEIMGAEPYWPALLHVLHWHGLIPSVAPDALPKMADDTVCATPDKVEQWVMQAQSIARDGRLWRDQWLDEWMREMRPLSVAYGGRQVNNGLALMLANLTALLSHPRLPLIVRNDLYRALSGRFMLHLPLLQQSNAPTWFVRQSRYTVRRKALENFGGIVDGPGNEGVFYLVLRDMPHGIEYVKKASRPWITWGLLCDHHFLARLAVALCLDDRVPEHCQLRSQLLHDPNRFVRAAAQKAVAWPVR